MAIVEPAPDGDHLAQGDILRGLTVYRAQADTNVDLIQPDFALVLSRNCNAAREAHVLVTPIKVFRHEGFGKLQDQASLDRSRRYLASLRDGWTEPDVFYLGPLPDVELGPRYAADFRFIYAVGLPTIATERSRWVSSRRIARLSRAHRRHLHARLFRALSDEGFDDYAWWPTSDLDLVASAGAREVAILEQEIAELKLKMSAGRSDGKTNEKKLRGLQDGLNRKNNALQAKQIELRPYQAELERRTSD